MVSETALRTVTDILLANLDFTGDRMARVQAAYSLATRIAHILRPGPEEQTFSAAAWEAFDQWRSELEDNVGFHALGEIPAEELAGYFHDCPTLADATEKVLARVG